MGDVIHFDFSQRARSDEGWRETHEKLIRNLTEIGSTYGDCPKLMRAKADLVIQMLREMIDELPNVKVHIVMPPKFDDEDCKTVSHVVQGAAAQAIESTVTHMVKALMSQIDDLCTSRLGENFGG